MKAFLQKIIKFLLEGHHVRMTDDVDVSQAVGCPVAAGACTIHTGNAMKLIDPPKVSLHYTGGNSTTSPRRAYIINCRPEAMVKYERENSYDHGKSGLEIITSLKPK